MVEWCGGERSERRGRGPAIEWSDMWSQPAMVRTREKDVRAGERTKRVSERGIMARVGLKGPERWERKGRGQWLRIMGGELTGNEDHACAPHNQGEPHGASRNEQIDAGIASHIAVETAKLSPDDVG